MGTIQITKLEVAINHMQMAIDMFLNNKDLLCILTLAGAAEEILGQYATKANKKTMLDLLCSSLKEEYYIDTPDKGFKWEYLNKAKNTVKHFDDGVAEAIEINPEAEALTMLIRATGNLYSHERTVTYNTPALMEWIYTNRKNLFPSSSYQVELQEV